MRWRVRRIPAGGAEGEELGEEAFNGGGASAAGPADTELFVADDLYGDAVVDHAETIEENAKAGRDRPGRGRGAAP